MRFEYRLVPVQSIASVEPLNAAGAEGFDVVSVVTLSSGATVAVMKRAVPADAPAASASEPPDTSAGEEPSDELAAVHPRWAQWLAEEVSGAQSAKLRKAVEANFSQLFDARGRPLDKGEVTELARMACRLVGVDPPEFLG